VERELLVERLVELERRRLQRLIVVERELVLERKLVLERVVELERGLVLERVQLLEYEQRRMERYNRLEFGRYMGVT
jgi:hypothetical protein